jgi:hypothetical protein
LAGKPSFPARAWSFPAPFAAFPAKEAPFPVLQAAIPVVTKIFPTGAEPFPVSFTPCLSVNAKVMGCQPANFVNLARLKNHINPYPNLITPSVVIR